LKITVRCYFIPADVTFDLADVASEQSSDSEPDSITLYFRSGGVFSLLTVDKQHYFDEKSKK